MKKILFVVIYFIFLIPTFCDEVKPRLSIITSIYKGDKFIESFLSDITKQTIFDECELILINANSPENEEKVINEYLKYYPNIVYVRLLEDPGLYSVWNLGIKLATSDIICNANIDDASKEDSFERHVEFLERNPDVDLVYSGYLITQCPNENFKLNNCRWFVNPCEFSVKNMRYCLPGPRPVWRKSFHQKYGYFDESFKYVGDFEMWNRAAILGAQFRKIKGFYTLYYLNPEGLSTNKAHDEEFNKENSRIIKLYSQFWR